ARRAGRRCGHARTGETFEIPLDLPNLPFGMARHPRHDADPAHGWLRARARESMTGGGEGRAEAEAQR
ncbi:hypothetical protein ACWGQT_08885, partial [Streptomyces yangpuensis]